MLDAHNHLDRCPDPAQALARARAAGVRGQVLAGVDPAGWASQAALAGEPGLWACFGVHPWTAAAARDEDEPPLLEALVRALDGGLGVDPVGLGELGLDRGRQVAADSLPRQERLFRAQLALARERDLPVVLHVVRAHDRALAILRRDGLPAAGGMVHSASTPPEQVAAWLALGLHMSFAGGVTRHDKARAAAARVPLERLLAETDAPDQPPAGRQGSNEPAFLPDVVAALAEVHGLPPTALAARVEDNARRLFRLPSPERP
ncbi:TatD family hydrolase [Myxococcota bacterium]|nr:TatD family hydrolase [Myxococcota bacterium]